jgi:hypothetical protein
MTGVYDANDGGTYYIRQLGNTVWWVGMSGDGGQLFSNVFKGTKTGNSIVGEWADVPKGSVRSSGTLSLRGGPVSFDRVGGTGGFGGSRWVHQCNDTSSIPSR